MTQRNRALTNTLLLLLALIPFLYYIHLFSQFFPNAQGKLGHDLRLSGMLAGIYQRAVNPGWFTTVWCSPWTAAGLCGHGFPPIVQFLNVFNLVPYFINTHINLTLLQQIQVGFFFKALVGYWGFYLVLRRRFSLSQALSLLGAVLFLFNSFCSTRTIIGHGGYNNLFYIPWFLLALLPNPAPPKPWDLDFKRPYLNFLIHYESRQFVLLSMILAVFLYHANIVYQIIPYVLIGIGAYCLQPNGCFNLVAFFKRLLAASMVAIVLALPQFVTGKYALATLNRTQYKLPGFSSLGSELYYIFIMLFGKANNAALTATLANKPWFAFREHELTYSVSWAPFIMLLGTAFYLGKRILNSDNIDAAWAHFSKTIKPYEKKLWLLALVLVIPVVFNYYHPTWNKIIKATPIIQQVSALFRWFQIYVPLAILAAVVAFNQVRIKRGYLVIVFCLGLIPLVQQTLVDRSFYHAQYYNPKPMSYAYQEFKKTKHVPPITELAVQKIYDTTQGRYVLRQNELFVKGASSLQPYAPKYGYRLENFPYQQLHIGSIYDVSRYGYNMLNPVCFLFPKENNCKPGDVFKLSQRAELEAFAHYKPYVFNVPFGVTLSRYIAFLAWVFMLSYWVMVLKLQLSQRKINKVQQEPVAVS